MTIQFHYQGRYAPKNGEYQMELGEELFARHQLLMYVRHYVRPEIDKPLQSFLPTHRQSYPSLRPPIAILE